MQPLSPQLGGIASWLGSMLNGMVEKILSIFITPISMLLYAFQIGFFWLIDCVQGIFRSMAGLDLYYYQGEEQSGDMVLSILTSDIIMSIFWGVLVVAIMLLFVTTFVAIIRSEFVEKGANPKGPIIGRAIKSLAYFAVVPVVCLMGIWIANVFLKSLDEATSGQASSLSTTVFFAASHDANRARNDAAFAQQIKDSEIGQYLGLNVPGISQEEIALAIDEAFLQRVETPGDHTFNISGDHMFTLGLMKNVNAYYIETFDTSNFAWTYYFYDLFLGYNYLIGFMGGFVAAMLLLTSCIGIIQRLFELSILFVVSPPFVAFMPLDDGAKYKQWRGEFVKRVGAMYGPIIGLNLMFIILAVLRDIDIFPDTGIYAVFNSIVQLIFLIVGLLSVKEFSSLISSMIGSEDALAKGDSKKDGVTSMAGRVGAGAINAARLGVAATKVAGRAVKGGASKVYTKSGAADSTAMKNWREEGRQKGKYFTDQGGKVVRRSFQRKGDTAFTGSADDLQGAIKGQRAAEQKDIKKKGLRSQLTSYSKGQGYLTELGTAWDGVLTAGGSATKRFTYGDTLDRAKKGESIMGALPIFSGKDAKGKKTKRGNLASYAAQLGSGKERADKDEDSQFGYKEQEKAEFELWKSEEGNEKSIGAMPEAQQLAEFKKWKYGQQGAGAGAGGTGGTSTGGGAGSGGPSAGGGESGSGTGDGGNANDVNLTGSDIVLQTDDVDDEAQKVVMDPAVIESLNAAIQKLSAAADRVGSAGKTITSTTDSLRTAMESMRTEINRAARELPDAVFRGLKDKK